MKKDTEDTGTIIINDAKALGWARFFNVVLFLSLISLSVYTVGLRDYNNRLVNTVAYDNAKINQLNEVIAKYETEYSKKVATKTVDTWDRIVGWFSNEAQADLVYEELGEALAEEWPDSVLMESENGEPYLLFPDGTKEAVTIGDTFDGIQTVLEPTYWDRVTVYWSDKMEQGINYLSNDIDSE